MKLSSSTLCGCCFCCYCHCWLMMLLMVSSIVHVSPEISTITNKKSSKLYNNNYAYRSKMTDFIQPSRKLLNSKITAATVTTASTTSMLSKLSPLPTPQPQPTAFIPTTDIHYKQNTRNSYPVFEHETKTTVDSKQTKSTISSRVLASGTQPLTSTSASKQLQITERSNQYDTPIAGPAPTKSKNRRKTEHESQGTSNTFNRHFELLSATSRTTMTNNYAADKSNVFLPSTLLRIEQTTINPFIQTVAKVKTKKSINDYSRNYDSDKSKKYGNLTVDSKSILKQEYIDITAGSNKSKSSKSDKDCKQKTKYSFCINHNNRVAAIKTNSATINTTTQALQQKCLETKMESKSRNAFDATQKKVSAINSLPSNSTTDFLRHSRNNFKSHKSNSSRSRSRSSNSYDHMSSSTPNANSTSHKEISQYPVHAYHLHKLTSTPTTTTSSLSLQLQLPSDSWSLHEHRHSNIVQRSVLLHRHGRQAAAEEEQSEKCRMFIEGDPEKNELYSPEYPNDYPKNINCTRIITAPKGQIIRLDFRNSFNIEEKEECKFDFLEVRDGQYGFSNLIGKYCGTDFPPEITSKERYLWLHFHSDESIEYSGFTAVYEFIDRNRDAPSTDLNCTIEKDGFEGFINATDVPTEIKDTVIRNKIPLDCIWRIQVQEKWKIQIKFVDFKLAKPNDCETNFLDIFPEQTVMPLRVKNFCGSAGEGITSDSNILHMRFYAEQIAINSTFSILYTAFRERGSSSCAEDEYDCEDATCIAADLKCNGRSNCKFLWDEEGCEEEDEGQSEHMIIIITVFGLILGGMVVTFLVNCIRKIMHDQKIIREHIRQSKESKLDEMGRNSKARSGENISVVSPRQKHSQTSLQILDDVSNRYYREMELQTKNSFKEKDASILRHDMIVQTSLCSTDDSSTTTTERQQQPTPPIGVSSKACDMGCQTRESLFATASLLRQKSKTPSTTGSQRTIEGVPPPPRFSTFGYDAAQIAPPPPPTVSTLSRRNMHLPQDSLEMEQLTQQPSHTLLMMPHQQQQQQQQQQQMQQPKQHLHHQHLHHRPLQEICHHHHQHQQHLQQQHQKPTLPHHHAQQQQQQQQPQQQQHIQLHHHTSAATIPPNVTQLPISDTAVVTAISTGTSGRHREPGTGNAAAKNKPNKLDESKVFIDIRNSAPDVIIMTSH